MKNENNAVYTMEDFHKDYTEIVEAIETLGCSIFENPEIEEYMKNKHIPMDYTPFWIALEYIEQMENGLI